MNFLTEYWFIAIAIIAILIVGGYCLYVFINRPTDEQIKKVKEWLLYATSEAEKKLGSGTGQIKLRYAYDMFLAKFPWLARAISFDAFSSLVDESLNKLKIMLETNQSLKTYIDAKE